MKKTTLIALIAIFTAGPVLADGWSKKSPKASSGDKTCGGCKVLQAIAWTLKLPFRVVTSTTVGLYDLVVDQDFDGFSDGYHLIK